jgi:putative ATP-dependent endonuclease of OLD family
MHLHPQLQERLRRHLADTPHQVIYTTHSPLMVDLGNWRSVRRVDRGGHFLPTHDVLAEATVDKNGVELPCHGWLDDMTATKKKHVTTLLRENNELLFAEKVALVEGAADKHCLQVIPELMGRDVGKITSIVCGGKGNVPDYQILCRVFGVPFFTVYDQDTGNGEDANQNDRIRGLAGGRNLYGFTPNMEHCFGITGNHDKGMKTIMGRPHSQYRSLS